MLLLNLMSREPILVSPLATLEQAARIMRDRAIGFLPVCREGSPFGELQGVLTDRDIVVRAVALGRDGPYSRAADVMTAPAIAVRDTDPPAQAASLMAMHRIRRLPVIDSRGRLVGVISAASICSITGEIAISPDQAAA